MNEYSKLKSLMDKYPLGTVFLHRGVHFKVVGYNKVRNRYKHPDEGEKWSISCKVDHDDYDPITLYDLFINDEESSLVISSIGWEDKNEQV